MAKPTTESKEDAPRVALPHLAPALAGAGIARDAQVLLLGGGSAGAQKTFAPILATHNGPLYFVDAETAESPARATRVGADPFTAALPTGIGLCIAMPALARMPDVVEGLLYDSIYGALADGGIAAVPLPRDVSDKTLIAQGIMLSRVREGLQNFLTRHFGAEVLDSPELIAAKFAACAYFEFVALASRSRPSFTADPVVWLIVRKRPATPDMRGAARAFPRTARADQFALSDLSVFVAALKNADIAFVAVEAFAKRYRNYTGLRDRRRQKFAPFGHLKFDLHGNIRRAVEIAAMLHAQSVPGLFLMMHRHPLNEDFYDSDATWHMLKEIEDMGHEIGIHADPFCLIREAGDFQEGMTAALADMRGRGFRIRTATLHGDTREHIKARQLQANDFFRERYRRSKWDGLPPEGEEELAKHVHRYSHKEIAAKLGIKYFSEVNFLQGGRLLTEEPMLYLSDNARALRISSIPKAVSPREQLTAKTPFIIDAEFTREAADILRRRPFLALFHPQWYW